MSHAPSSAEYAAELDALPLNPATGHTSTRALYEIPQRGAVGADGPADDDCVYMAGNSLGLLPRRAREIVNQELDVWSSRAVVGHFDHPHARPWKDIDATVTPALAGLVGAEPAEVACTSTLTSNLHNLFVSFFRPDTTAGAGEGRRRKILVEGKAFPSDQYAVQSHLDLHGLGPECLIELFPRAGEVNLRTEDILRTIDEQGDEIALVWLSGVQYYTGQWFAMPEITRAAKAKGCVVGWDLAHAVGNVPLELHAWGVDFAVWCHYKYLNSGAGAVAGLFVHSNHTSSSFAGPRLAGWWGHDPSTRFAMPSTFAPIAGAGAWQHSNPPMLSMLPLIATLETIGVAGGPSALRARSERLTAYLERLLLASKFYRPAGDYGADGELSFTILTPSAPSERGAQLSLAVVEGKGETKGVMVRVFDGLLRRGVLGDERKPDVIRLSPIPLYSTFEDVRLAARCFEEALEEEAARARAARP